MAIQCLLPRRLLPRRPSLPRSLALAFVGVLLAGSLGAAAQVDEPAATLELRGVVADSEGHPLAGARVELLPMDSRRRGNERLLAGDLQLSPHAVAVTDNNGRYQLRGPAPGMLRLRVRAEGLLPWELGPLPVPGPGPPLEVSIASPPAAVSAKVRIETPAGGPAGGLVWLVPPGYGFAEADGWGPASRIAQNDHGDVFLPWRPDEELVLLGSAPGFLPGQQLFDGRPLRLQTGVLRSLQLVSPRGEPLAGVIVRLASLGIPVAVSGPDGRVKVPVTDASSPLDLRLLLPSGVQQPIRLGPAVAGGNGADEEVVVEPAMRLAGRVKSADGGPLAEAMVWPVADPGRFVLTDGRGRFELSLSRTDTRIQAMAAGHRPRELKVEAAHFSDRRLPTLVLPADAALRGRVVDLSGQPVEAAALAVDTHFGGPRPYQAIDRAEARAYSADDGGFLLPRLEPERVHRLRITHRSYLDSSAETATTASGRTLPPLVVVLIEDRSAWGRVIDEAGRPIAGTWVALTPAGQPLPRLDGGSLEGSSAEGGPPKSWPHAARTGEDGGFRIHSVPADVVAIHAIHPSYLPLRVRGVEVPRAGDVALGELVLARGSRLEGWVVSADEEPVEGAEIHLLQPTADPRRLGDEEWARLARGPEAAVTGAAGDFAVSGVEPGRSFDLLVRHRDHAPALVQRVEAPSAVPLIIELAPGHLIAGLVLEESGEPVSGAEIDLRLGEKAEPGSPDGTSQRAAVSGHDGRFAIAGALPGPARLQIHAPGLVPPEPRSLRIPEDTEEELIFELARGSELRGRISNEDDEPVSGARILVGAQATLSDTDGRYQTSGLPEGTARFELTHPAYPSRLREVEIEEGMNELDVVLPAGVEVSGRVINGSGEPVAGVRVEMERAELRHQLRYQTVSDAEGAFELSAVTAGTYRLEARRPGWAPATREPLVVGEQSTEDLEVVLLEGTDVTGWILGLDFDELARVSVRAEAEGHRAFPGAVRYDGRYRVEDLPAGSYQLRARSADGRRQAQARIVVTGDGGEVVQDLELGSLLTLSGRVLLAGEPLAAANLSLRGLDLAVSRSVRTDHEGAFRIEDLPAGAYHLGVSHRRELVVHNQSLRLDGDQELLLDLAPAQVAGQVIDQDGVGLEGTTVVLRRLAENHGEEGLLSLPGDSQGRFRFARVPPGRYRLEVRREGYGAYDELLTLGVGERREQLEVRLVPAAGLRVVVSTSAGAPPRALFAVLSETGVPVVQEIRDLDAGGAVRLATVPDGSWRLMVSAAGSASVTVEGVAAGEDVAVFLPPEAALELRIFELELSDVLATVELLDAAGRPLQVLDGYQGLTQSWTLTAGRGLVHNLPPGSWTLRVRASDGRSWQQSVVTVAGQVSVLEI